MDPLKGAALAAAVAWASIIIAIHVPLDRWFSMGALRRAGALTLVLVGLGILGVPHAAKVGIVVLVVGLIVSALMKRKRGADRP